MPSAFETGQRLGMEAVQAGSNQAQVALRTREARREFDIESERTQKQREIENAMASNRQNMIAGEYLMKQKLLMQDMQRLTSAENAFTQFQTELATLDKGAQDFPQRYSDLTLRYVPTIAEHEQVNRKFSALNDAITKGTEYANKVANQSSLQQLVRDLAVYQQGAKAMSVQADVKAGKISATEGIVALTADLEAAKQARELAAEERKIAGQERVAEKRAGVAKDKADRSVTRKTIDKQTGEEITETLTPEEWDARKAKEKTAAEDAAVEPLVRMYREHAANIQAGDKRTGFANMSSREERMKSIETQLRAKGYDTEGNRLGSAKPAESPATNDDPLGLYK